MIVVMLAMMRFRFNCLVFADCHVLLIAAELLIPFARGFSGCLGQSQCPAPRIVTISTVTIGWRKLTWSSQQGVVVGTLSLCDDLMLPIKILLSTSTIDTFLVAAVLRSDHEAMDADGAVDASEASKACEKPAKLLIITTLFWSGVLSVFWWGHDVTI